MARRLLGIISCCFALTNSLLAQTLDATTNASEFVAEIRTHGNARIADDEVVRLSGLQVGQRLEEGTLADVEVRLRKSGRFDSVEIRKRYRSLDDFSQVAVLLVVHERLDAGGSALTSPLRKIRSRVMFLPILKYDDGYGWTYGVRSGTADLIGIGERLSVPLSWGGTKRAAIELERAFEHGPVSRVQSNFGISSRVNPRFSLADRRWEVNAMVERKVRILRLGVEAGGTDVEFGSLEDRYLTYGANISIDTRGDPAF